MCNFLVIKKMSYHLKRTTLLFCKSVFFSNGRQPDKGGGPILVVKSRARTSSKDENWTGSGQSVTFTETRMS